jgi:ferredoxin
MKRQIIEIDEELCTGCGNCIPGCPEGALQVIDGKARLVSDLFCDGLGACIGECPEGAMHVIEREAEPYDEKKTMSNIVKAGPNTVKAHLEHLYHHGEMKLFDLALEYLNENNMPVPTISVASSGTQHTETIHTHEDEINGCPGSMARTLELQEEPETDDSVGARQKSFLKNWPIQIKLVPVQAPYFSGSDLLIASDCTGMSYPNFHEDFVKGKILVQGCPKLDDQEFYVDKLAQIFKLNDIKTIKLLMMEVPCCFGMAQIIETAMKKSGKSIPVDKQIITINGGLKSGIF